MGCKPIAIIGCDAQKSRQADIKILELNFFVTVTFPASAGFTLV